MLTSQLKKNLLQNTARRNYADKTFDKVLVANRGEITRRVIKTAKKMGVKTVAVYSDADAFSMFVKEADEAYRIGPPPTNQSYLKMDTILEVIKASGAQAVHPGYGFLSENCVFQDMMQKNNIKFIGPPQEAIKAMGDKIESKKYALEAKVNTVPGFVGEIHDDKEAIKIANEIGYPVMIKASAGGGGKGMRIANNDKECVEGYRLSKDEALASFGDDRIMIEKYILEPKHIEYQILGDEHGNYVYMPERECSVQRRNQKVIEEAPSATMDPETRKKMGEQAVSLARSCGYQSTGTVEFLMDKNKDFYFLEMNTRLQVEHPITEEITGVDLVEQQLRIAAGYPLKFKQEDIKINGHAVEYRVYAEDPSRKFLPSIGFLKKYQEPEPHKHIRLDTGVQEGSEISMYYDPMISKLITWGKDRKEAHELLDQAFDQYVIQGVTHNLGFGKSIIHHESYSSGKYTTAFIPDFYPKGYFGEPLLRKDHDILALAGFVLKEQQIHRQGAPFSTEEMFVEFLPDTPEGEKQTFRVAATDKNGVFEISNASGDGQVTEVDIKSINLKGNALLNMDFNGTTERVQFLGSENDLEFKFYYRGANRKINVLDGRQHKVAHHMPKPKVLDLNKVIISPMPGAIVSVGVEVGQKVQVGQELLVIEAMKMQNLIKSEVEGKVKSVKIKPGQAVGVDEVLIEFE